MIESIFTPKNKVQSKAGLGLVIWVIWFALLFAQVVYWFVAHQSGNSAAASDTRNVPDTDSFSQMLAVVAAVLLFLAILVRLFVTNRIVKKDNPDSLARALPFFIISLALTEAVAIFGLILAMIKASSDQCIPFFVFAFVAMFLQAPIFAPFKISLTEGEEKDS